MQVNSLPKQIPFTKNLQKYIIKLPEGRYDFSFNKLQKINIQAAKKICEEFIHDCMWTNRVMETRTINLKLHNPTPLMIYINNKMEKLYLKLQNNASDYIDARKSEVLQVYELCKTILDSKIEMPRFLINISLIPHSTDQNIMTGYEAINRINSLRLLLDSYQTIQKIPVAAIPLNQVVRLLDLIWDNRNKYTSWFPRSIATDRVEEFVATFNFKFDAISNEGFIVAIRTAAKHLIKVLGYDETRFFMVYLIVYRYAFDKTYTLTFPKQKFVKKFNEIIEDTTVYCENAIEHMNSAKESLTKMMFETNPIDIGFHLGCVNANVASAVKAQYAAEGKKIPVFISYDESVAVYHKIFIEMQYGYIAQISNYLDSFTRDREFPEFYKCSCEAFHSCAQVLLSSAEFA